MKTQIILIISVFYLLFERINSQCASSFSQVMVGSNSYCVKCDTTCLTCSGSTMGDCITCPTDFTFDQATSYCYPPTTNQINTVQSSYKFYNFPVASGWTGGTKNNDCEKTTILKATGSISRTHSLSAHYKLRLLVSLWWVNTSSTDITITITSNPSKSITVSRPSAQPNTTYCGGSYALNIDSDSQASYNIPDLDSTASVTVTFSSSGEWGIRQYIFIEYKCAQNWCKKCTGPGWNQCTQCADTNRKLYSGECRCDPTKHYFMYPSSLDDASTTLDDNYCVSPCPHRPSTGKFYGDPSTQTCVSTCPLKAGTTYGMTFADDVSAQCVDDCPATNMEGLTYYHDTTNRACVTNCPSTQPYKYDDGAGNITCLASCPTGYYKLDTKMQCSQTCPKTNDVPLYIDTVLGACVHDCQGADWWADDITGYCVSDCAYHNGDFYFQDNTTTKNRCTRICPQPLYFGDVLDTTKPAGQQGTGKCIDHCYGGKFGDTHPSSDRHCVTLCHGNYFGLLTGNRACVQTCPDGTWGQKTTYTCALTPSGCDTAKYADNTTHLCVAKKACSQGQFSYDGPGNDRKCVIYCPDGTYAHDKHCQTGCSGSYFADPDINRCVTTCFGDGLYADVSSSNTCVTRCNQAGLTPFRDHTTKKCVAKCPSAFDLYSDQDAQECVYNCSIGRYKDAISDATDKKCVTQCPSTPTPLWGSNTTGYGVCVTRCPENPPLFGDTVTVGPDNFRICVDVCSGTNFGDQDPSGDRKCIPTCPDGYYAQDDQLRRCVKRCNSTTFGRSDKVCVKAQDCFAGQVGDTYTQKCTTWCSQQKGLFADDIVQNICVQKCPINDSVLYFADPTLRWCKATCNATGDYYGNNDTQTCEQKCIDFQSFADAQHPNRFCIGVCTNLASQIYYRNNQTKICVVPMDCQDDYYADNISQYCVRKCPKDGAIQTWGHPPTKTCVEKCYGPLWGDDTSGIPKCIIKCPALPMRWSYDPTMLCVAECPEADGLFGQDYDRTCVGTCPMDLDDTNGLNFTYAYNGTRRCLKYCPNGYYADYTVRKCWPYPQNCTLGWGDDWNNSCTQLCNGDPYNTYGDNETWKCQARCTDGSWADNYTGDRLCVNTCAGQYDLQGVSIGTYDRYADNQTQFCQQRCKMPETWADWQTHRCELRCSGDDPSDIPTYSENQNRRCVIALTCPFTPDKLYGDNDTRSCVTTCKYTNTQIQWADNITRTCLPQCINWTDSDPSVTSWDDGTTYVDTRFYGDTSKGSPICVIQCPQSPRLFGQNDTNRCVSQCPDNTYGDQTGNRSCVDLCPNIAGVTWFAQITQQLCVLVCQDGTWGNYHNTPIPKCATVPTDCIPGQFADNSTHLCVPLCPQSENYFGDPSTRLCVDRCPDLPLNVVNSTATINVDSGILYADYSTRLCVHKCPDDHGPRGTFGDNLTNTCVHRCPDGTYGDPQTVNRHCVQFCTPGTFADNLTNTCVKECPASPPYFGDKTDWVCVLQCPANTWADSISRQCLATCPSNHFRLSDDRRECVSLCPSTPDLYGDQDTYNCVDDCVDGSAHPFADPISRTCVDDCTPLFEYANRCVHLCPQGFYANSTNNCVLPAQCDGNTYGDNLTTKCIDPCVNNAYADPVSKYCIAVCPSGSWGYNNKCVSDCETDAGASFSSSDITQLCQSDCPQYTYHQDGICKAKCETGYANDDTGLCDTSCPSDLYTDPRTHDCVATCHDNQTDDSQDYFRDPQNGACVTDCSVLVTHKFKDFITGDCVQKCSSGYWGNTGNYTCIPECVPGQYGYQSTTQRICYTPGSSQVPTHLFGDPQSGQFIAVCPTTPKLYFGDRNRHQCKQQCTQYSGTEYYGDPSTRQCESVCQNASFYSADPLTDRCEIRCTQGTYRYNDTPICKAICPDGYADNTTRICVDVCPVQDHTFGFFNSSSVNLQRICVDQCPQNYYSQYTDRTCSTGCTGTYYALNTTHQCVQHCIDSFADDSNNKCMDICHNNFADNSTNQCVDECPSDPDYYGDDHVCVFYCITPNYYADPDSRQCVPQCPNLTLKTYGDPLTGRCVQTCSFGYFAQNTTNLCVKQCPTNTFAYNETRTCVDKCPVNENLYGDPFTHTCSFTCSNGYYGSQVNQECIPQCDLTYWGDPLTTLCVSQCPNKIYSFGQNDTRTCVTSCIGYSGFADNKTRLCRQYCQDTLAIQDQTFIDYLSQSCVEICPDGYYMENSTNECLGGCLTGFADNYSKYCVTQCPDNPQSYADEDIDVCLYSCINGRYSNNDTNMCVDKCPDDPDYYGDPHTGKCVFFCTQGTYGENDSRLCKPQCPDQSFADNLTRKCVEDCPPSQGTFADEHTNKCLRVCSTNYWARNDTQTCVGTCPQLSGLPPIQTYSDDISRFCVLECPDPYFGQNNTHSCVPQCSSTQNLFGHPKGRVCVIRLNCYPVDGQIYFADDTTRTCVQKCPLNRWADMTLKVCVSDCPVNQFRNMHTQVCVTNCPEDPDQYGDTTTDNCVRKCPDGYYAVVLSNTKRMCVDQCSSHGLIKDNSTNRCVGLYDCPTQPYMYGDLTQGACVLYCTTGYADNKTQTCVNTCPQQWEYFADTNDKICVSLCENYLFADTLNDRKCMPTCSGGYFADNQTSTCVQRCSFIKPFYYEDIPSHSCVQVCPDQSYAYDFNQTCLYTTNLGVSRCPPPFFADPISRKCVQQCPFGSFAKTSTRYCVNKCTGNQFADPVVRACVQTCSEHYFSLDQDPTNHLCVQFCPQPYFAENSTDSCVLSCSTLLALPSTRSCQSRCPQPYFADNDNHKCILDCQPNYADSFTRQCVPVCSSPAFSQPYGYTCVLLCPQDSFNNGSNICAQQCQNGTFANPYSRTCDTQCPEYPMLFADSRTNQCLPECSDPLFAFTLTRQCLQSCPNITGQIYLADTSNNKCVLECTNQQISFADYQNNQCTDFCPEGTFASNLTKQCVTQCPTVPVDTFGDNTSHICLKQCQVGFGDPDLLICVQQCTLPRYADPTTRICVQFCPQGYFAQQSLIQCRLTCLPNTYADPSIHECVDQCSAVQDLFKYHENWTCLEQCPQGYYAKQETRQCVQICQSVSIDLFAYQVTNQCLMECPPPYKGHVNNHTCILQCPDLYFYNVTRNLCTKCPDQCTECTGPYSCISCIPGYNLFNGICSYSCIPQNNLITYAHPTTNQCVEECPFGYFGDNSTYLCSQNCPSKQYGNSTTRKCQNCPQTCSLCNNSTFCTACEGDAQLAIDNMCYRACNSTHYFYYDGDCHLNCPARTYVSYTQVNCEVCSNICQNCSISPSNCTSCHDKYYYNNTCLTVCPDGFFGDNDLVCKPCSESQTDVCSQKLSFSTKISVENYKYVITMQFNKDVDIKQQLDKILKVKLKVNRRVLQINTYVNDGITYTYQILSNGSIKLYLDVQADLQNPVFDIQVIQPTAIVSKETGQSLQVTISQLIADQKIQYYSKEDGQQSPIRKASQFCIIFILILLGLIFMLSDTMMKPIQLIQLLFLHCLTTSPIPASLFFYLIDLKLSLLQFLPNWLSIPIPKDVTLHESSTQKTIDIFVDYNFIRNVGQILLPIIVAFSFWLIFFILSNKRVVSHKQWHGFLETISIRRFRWSLVNQILGMFYLPILWFGFMQFQQLFGEQYLGFNGFLTLVFVLAALALPFGWIYIWWKKQTQEIQQRFSFMTNRIAKQNHKAILEVPISFVHLLFCAIWLVGLINDPVAQMVLLILTNFAYVLYLIIVRPFLIHVNTIFTVIMLLLAISLQIFIAYFQINNEILNSSDKTALIYPFLIAMSVVLVLCIIWCAWRCVWQLMDIWKFFKTTNFYRQFGDPEVQQQKQVSENYEKYQKIVQNVQADLGDIVVENMIKQCNDKGENVIKVKKKVMKKKKKARRVKKNDGIEQNQEQFVRINNVNPFDYDYDSGYKKQEKKDVMKRTFDDDLRDIISDDEQQSPKKKKTGKISHSVNNFIEDKQQKHINVDDNEKQIKNLDDILEQKPEQKKQKQQDNNQSPFQFLDGFSELGSEKVSDNQLMDDDDDHHNTIQNKNQSAPKIDNTIQLQQNAQEQNNKQENNGQQQQENNGYQQGFDDLLIDQEEQPQKNNEQNLMKSNNKVYSDDNNGAQLYDNNAAQQDDNKNEVPQKKVKGIEELLQEQQQNVNKNKKLLFLFDDQQQQDENQ